MVLNGKELKDLIIEKNLLENYNLENIRSTSYDITISNKALEIKKSEDEISLFDANKIENLYKEINIDNGYILRTTRKYFTILKRNYSFTK